MSATAPTITSRTQYEVLRLFVAGKTEREIADITTVDVRAVARTINELTAGDRATAANAVAAYERRAAAVAAARGTQSPGQPAPPAADPLAQMLGAAAASPNRRVQALGEKLRRLADELRDALDREEQAAAAQRRVDELAAELEKAREVLRTASGRPARPATTAATAPAAGAASGVPAKTVRAWARQNGIEVPALGRIPGPVMDAYLQAHPAEQDTEGGPDR